MKFPNHNLGPRLLAILALVAEAGHLALVASQAHALGAMQAALLMGVGLSGAVLIIVSLELRMIWHRLTRSGLVLGAIWLVMMTLAQSAAGSLTDLGLMLPIYLIAAAALAVSVTPLTQSHS
ncbi:hypothetical protein RM531_08510 [Salinisphaera sp. P385]|uniref:Uncharacterized protein n=1 Tax=Spectribacter acetivorans TaxID=3075603 RepID=A0ABU3B7R7_9GAMM|nr:hypothetical protein [Salinisphaera sp. P385]MDT0618518.1 hypothetical protein [Salinisphaera sp. P385]